MQEYIYVGGGGVLGNASKTAFEEFPFYFWKSLKTGKG